jgi:hypothetical protein
MGHARDAFRLPLSETRTPQHCSPSLPLLFTKFCPHEGRLCGSKLYSVRPRRLRLQHISVSRYHVFCRRELSSKFDNILQDVSTHVFSVSKNCNSRRIHLPRTFPNTSLSITHQRPSLTDSHAGAARVVVSSCSA